MTLSTSTTTTDRKNPSDLKFQVSSCQPKSIFLCVSVSLSVIPTP